MSKFLANLSFAPATLNPNKRVSDTLSILACDRPHSGSSVSVRRRPPCYDIAGCDVRDA
jgi:hypothetical protein